MLITLKRDATCKQCGAPVAAGTKAKWYRDGSVYGLTCHERKDARRSRETYHGEDYPCSDLGYEDRCAQAVQ